MQLPVPMHLAILRALDFSRMVGLYRAVSWLAGLSNRYRWVEIGYSVSSMKTFALAYLDLGGGRMCVKPRRGSARAACFVSASARMRGERRAMPFSEPVTGGLAVQACRAGEGSGRQNGKWLLMACINLFGPGRAPESRPVLQRLSDPRPACARSALCRYVRIGLARPAGVT